MHGLVPADVLDGASGGRHRQGWHDHHGLAAQMAGAVGDDQDRQLGQFEQQRRDERGASAAEQFPVVEDQERAGPVREPVPQPPGDAVEQLGVVVAARLRDHVAPRLRGGLAGETGAADPRQSGQGHQAGGGEAGQDGGQLSAPPDEMSVHGFVPFHEADPPIPDLRHA
ncbi:hypothetical protein V2W30_20660 [Streptomyces sp. Q6]|uniref:Uncharacterized protein n=1 Tax=Streptomyces citrinus TaxID=3118173 RepID=A0ACD5AEH5_9ACTN